MRILVTIPCLMTGGTEIQTLNLVRALVEGGHEVVTACYFEHTDYMVEQYEKAGSRVVLFSQEGKRVGGLAGIRFLAKHLWRMKRSFKPDAVHVQYMAPGAIPIILLWLMGQKNILATAHTNADIYSPKQLRLVQFIQKHITRVFTCITKTAEKAFFGSAFNYAEHKGETLPCHAHYTIYNSLPSYIQITDKVREPKDVMTIGVVSRLETIKGMDLVIPAVEKVYRKHKNIKLLIVGDGTLRETMERSLTSNLSPLISFAGRQGQDTLQSYYDQIDILLMPSRSEGFGLTAIEGMARGCVVVASNTGGLPEVVIDGKVGLLHQPESIDDLADKISCLLENSALFEEMKRNLTGHVSQFTFEKYSTSFNKLYSSL
ncbi:Glycosyltransferase involved in cell wall bisynthesis [Prevotella sp. khp1]|uniref:glycosyltransferase family 4 protein n=1 Tax=Prevotellaceae TaxID=171552 RepID=UPI0008854A2B|nr:MULTISPECIES: glycosyltransferase family 4 protein [Prevotellaceae]QVJ80404.1 glycosyltransferase family 4 protein [Xylanibacter ruminicola]SDQ22524.1 Glycosyltransferase involved in cell wall bisynthesis [Prevotella sp. khp1]